MKITFKLVFLIVFFAIVSFATIRASFVGYIVKDAVSAEKIAGEDALMLNISLSHCSGVNERLLLAMERNSDELLLCTSGFSACMTNLSLSMLNQDAKIKSLENELLKEKEDSALIDASSNLKINGLEKVISEKEKELEALKANYELLASNSANNICCKQRIDNPEIGFYGIDAGRIACRDSGSLRISC